MVKADESTVPPKSQSKRSRSEFESDEPATPSPQSKKPRSEFESNESDISSSPSKRSRSEFESDEPAAPSPPSKRSQSSDEIDQMKQLGFICSVWEGYDKQIFKSRNDFLGDVKDIIATELKLTAMGVYKATNSSAIAFATSNKEDFFVIKLIREFDQEIEILKLLEGKSFCIELMESYSIPDRYFTAGMKLPFYQDTLGFLLERGDEIDTLKIIRQLFQALSYCHSVNVIHRDIKPSNILITEEHDIKLTDFGLSYIYQGDTLDSYMIGTTGYMSPEMMIGREYSFNVDIWSAGVVMYQCVTRKGPFFLDYDEDELDEILFNWNPERLSLDEHPKERPLLLKLLQPHNRPTAKEVLEDSYFSETE